MALTISGLKECQDLLANAPKNVVQLGYARAATAAMNVIAKELISKTPVRTGKLAKALVIDVVVDSSAKGVAAAVGFGKQGYVANWIEYGHKVVGHKPGKKQYGDVPEHPFMRPAFDSSASEALDAFAESLVATLKEIY